MDMLLKKYAYEYIASMMVAVVALCYYFINHQLIGLCISIIAIFAILFIQNICSIKLYDFIYNIHNGQLSTFEKNKHQLIHRPIRLLEKILYGTMMGEYLYLRGDKEEGKQILQQIISQYGQKHSMIYRHYVKQDLAMLCMFLLVEGDIQQANIYMEKKQDKPSPLLAIGNLKNIDIIFQFTQEALQYEKDHQPKRLYHLRMCLENELELYTRMYLMMYLARCYEVVDKDIARSYYQSVAMYGNEFDIRKQALAKCKEMDI